MIRHDADMSDIKVTLQQMNLDIEELKKNYNDFQRMFGFIAIYREQIGAIFETDIIDKNYNNTTYFEKIDKLIKLKMHTEQRMEDLLKKYVKEN